jgi:hypothetical protein
LCWIDSDKKDKKIETKFGGNFDRRLFCELFGELSFASSKFERSGFEFVELQLDI